MLRGRYGRRALTGEDTGQLHGELILWDLATGEIIDRFGGELEEVIEGVLDLAVIPDGRTALVGYRKNSALDTQTVAYWDIEAGEVIRFLEGSDQGIFGVANSPDGRLGYGASADSNIYVWELGSGELVQTLRDHEGNVTNITIGPNGLKTLSGALDGEMILWDLAAGRPPLRVRHVRWACCESDRPRRRPSSVIDGLRPFASPVGSGNRRVRPALQRPFQPGRFRWSDAGRATGAVGRL